MSRIGKLPIDIPDGVTVTIADNNIVTIKGKHGELTQQVNPEIKVKKENNQVIVERPSDLRRHKALHGLYRSLLSNMVYGVSQGYEIKQVLEGVGYRATAKGQLLEMQLGLSHLVVFELPPEVKVEAVTERRQSPVITLQSADKQLIGQIAAKIRSLKPPEPYKGKGIKYAGEYIRRKAGKAAASA